MPANDAQRDNRFHIHLSVCLLFDDERDGSLQFVPETPRFIVQSGLPRQIVRYKARQQFRAEPLPRWRFDNPMIVFLPLKAKQPACIRVPVSYTHLTLPTK